MSAIYTDLKQYGMSCNSVDVLTTRKKRNIKLVVGGRVIKTTGGFLIGILIMGGVVLRGEGVVDVCAG